MSERKLKTASESETARRVREVLGLGPDEEITVSTPTFNRPAGWPTVAIPPARAFEGLREKSSGELRELGCRQWEEEPDAGGRVLMLFPADWYLYIPDGFLMESILAGARVVFKRGVTSDDRRFGMLAYGIRVFVERKQVST